MGDGWAPRARSTERFFALASDADDPAFIALRPGRDRVSDTPSETARGRWTPGLWGGDRGAIDCVTETVDMVALAEARRWREPLLHDQFLKTFSTKGAEKREQNGCTGSHVFRDPDDPHRVWVFFDWKIEDYERFLADPSGLTCTASTPPGGRATGSRGSSLLGRLEGFGGEVLWWLRIARFSEPGLVRALTALDDLPRRNPPEGLGDGLGRPVRDRLKALGPDADVPEDLREIVSFDMDEYAAALVGRENLDAMLEAGLTHHGLQVLVRKVMTIHQGGGSSPNRAARRKGGQSRSKTS